MTKQNIYKKTLLLSIPMIIQSGIANAVVLADNLMVGSLGTEKITGVSITGQLLFVFNLAVFGGVSGPGIYCAQYYGNGDKEGFQRVFRLKLWIALLITLFGSLLFIFRGPDLISLYLTGQGGALDPAETLNQGLIYLNLMTAGLIPLALTQVYGSSMREMGESIAPMAAGVLSVFVDILLNYILIYGKFGFPRLEVKGAALATVAARFVEFAFLIAFRRLKADRYPFLDGVYRTILIPVREMRPVIKKSIPIFLNEFFWAAGMAALAQCYSIRGLSVVAGLNIANVICNLFNTVFVSMGSAVGIIEGQFLGASRFEEARDSAMKLTWFNGGICIILTAILIAISGLFPRAYNTSNEVRTLATWFIVLISAFFPLEGLLNSLYFIIRSGGRTLITFLFDSVFTWCISVPLAFVLCSYSSLHIFTVLIIVQAANIIKVTVGMIMVKKGLWITNLVAN